MLQVTGAAAQQGRKVADAASAGADKAAEDVSQVGPMRWPVAAEISAHK